MTKLCRLGVAIGAVFTVVGRIRWWKRTIGLGYTVWWYESERKEQRSTLHLLGIMWVVLARKGGKACDMSFLECRAVCISCGDVMAASKKCDVIVCLKLVYSCGMFSSC